MEVGEEGRSTLLDLPQDALETRGHGSGKGVALLVGSSPSVLRTSDQTVCEDDACMYPRTNETGTARQPIQLR